MNRPARAELPAPSTVVVGGSSGIGLAISAAFARLGSTVFVWSRSAPWARSVADLADRTGRVHAVRCDVTDPASVRQALRYTEARTGRIGAALCCAGINAPHPFPDTPWPQQRQVLRVNLWGNAVVIREVAGHMAARGGGSLVVTSSIAGLRGQATTADYAASKAGLAALARAAAVDLAPYRVRVNLVTPGYVRTPLLDRYTADHRFTAKVTARTPAGRLGVPADLTGLAVFLCSDAAGYVTGAEFVVDGGYTCA